MNKPTPKPDPLAELAGAMSRTQDLIHRLREEMPGIVSKAMRVQDAPLYVARVRPGGVMFAYWSSRPINEMPRHGRGRNLRRWTSDVAMATGFTSAESASAAAQEVKTRASETVCVLRISRQ